MSKPASERDGVSVVIPVRNVADRLDKLLAAWGDALARLGRDYEILVVDDGSTDGTSGLLEKFVAGRVKHLRVFRHDTPRGFGASLRTALADVRYPLCFYTTPDYPYTPSDLAKLLPRIEIRDEILHRQPDLISGCRTGRPVPPAVKGIGRAWRLLWRVTLGLPLQPRPAWLGLREYLYETGVGWVFGVPLTDANSAFKLYRTAFLKRVPIQSDGDFVHAELAAKATFLTCIMDEIPLTPSAAPLPARGAVVKDMLRVLRNPDFGTPATAVPPHEPPQSAALPDTRHLEAPPPPEPLPPASPLIITA